MLVWLSAVLEVGLVALAAYFGAYLRRKGDNAAVVESIEEVTTRQQSVLSKYEERLELYKSHLDIVSSDHMRHEELREKALLAYLDDLLSIVRLCSPFALLRLVGSDHQVITEHANAIVERLHDALIDITRAGVYIEPSDQKLFTEAFDVLQSISRPVAIIASDLQEWASALEERERLIERAHKAGELAEEYYDQLKARQDVQGRDEQRYKHVLELMQKEDDLFERAHSEEMTKTIRDARDKVEDDVSTGSQTILGGMQGFLAELRTAMAPTLPVDLLSLLRNMGHIEDASGS